MSEELVAASSPDEPASEAGSEAVAALDGQDPGKGGVAPNPTTSDEAESDDELGRLEYERLRAAVRARVEAAVPRGSTVLVVSRGDADLVRFDGRRGWHFPRDEEGKWAGYHPADSAEAITQIQELRTKGADYLVFPRTAFWWLDYYTELSEHLESRYSTAARDEWCLVFVLHVAGEVVLRSFLDSLLPVDATVAIVSSNEEPETDIAGRRAWRFPRATEAPGEDKRSSDAGATLEELEELRARGAQFLVVPRPSADEHFDLLEQVALRYPCIARRAHVAAVFDLMDGREPRRRGALAILSSWARRG